MDAPRRCISAFAAMVEPCSNSETSRALEFVEFSNALDLLDKQLSDFLDEDVPSLSKLNGH